MIGKFHSRKECSYGGVIRTLLRSLLMIFHENRQKWTIPVCHANINPRLPCEKSQCVIWAIPVCHENKTIPVCHVNNSSASSEQSQCAMCTKNTSVSCELSQCINKNNPRASSEQSQYAKWTFPVCHVNNPSVSCKLSQCVMWTIPVCHVNIPSVSC
jgi:hypothetical protein